ncbi:MAG: hypothetical protein R3Y40_05385 [Eubacteriales bacterium]
MRQYTTKKTTQVVEEKELGKIICNQCGEEIKVDVTKGEVFQAKYSWGYGSKYDLQRHEFDLCETCYDKLIQGFKIPIDVEELIC